MTMRNIDNLRRELSPERRKKIEARAAELIAEEMTLQQLRHARKLTQVRMAKELGISQDGVSRLEKRSDLLLSTLRKTVEAMGGSLSLIAEFPDRGPVALAGIAAGRAGARLPADRLARPGPHVPLLPLVLRLRRRGVAHPRCSRRDLARRPTTPPLPPVEPRRP